MSKRDWLTGRFEASRPRLQAVAYRMLGSHAEADDAVQEVWLRIDRADASQIDNLGGWLTTITARVCLDRLRSRRARQEELVGTDLPRPHSEPGGDTDPAQQVLLAESVGSALLVVLDLLAPAERVAFVLHDIFAVSFDEIGPIVGRSPQTARQLASRARRRLQGTAPSGEADLARQREVVDAFLAASRNGDFAALLAMLDPQVVLHADGAAVRMGAPAQTCGAGSVAAICSGGARGARRAIVDGVPALVWAPGRQRRAVISFTITSGRITDISLIGQPERMRKLDIVLLDD
jgi:RNA polymerase sigma factor (sigma-70 family)